MYSYQLFTSVPMIFNCQGRLLALYRTIRLDGGRQGLDDTLGGKNH